MMNFEEWFTVNYPNDSLSKESLEFILKDIELKEQGDRNNTHWCYTYLNGDRQFVFSVLDRYISYRRL